MTTLFLLCPCPSQAAMHLSIFHYLPQELLTGAGGAALLISPTDLTAPSQAVMVTHRCRKPSNTAAKDGRS